MPGPMAVGLAKNGAARVVAVLDEERAQIEHVDPGPAQLIVKTMQHRRRIGRPHVEARDNFLGINRGLRRNRNDEQLDPARFQLLLKIENRGNRILQFRFVGAADLRRVVAPETTERKQPQLAAEKQPAIHTGAGRGVFLFEVLDGCRQLGRELLLRVRERSLGRQSAGQRRQQKERAEKSHWS